MTGLDRRAVLAGAGLFAAGGPAATGAVSMPANEPPSPRLIPAVTARIIVGEPIELGTIQGVRKRIIPITGGTFWGKVDGTVLPGGADWQVVRPDGVAEITARYTLRASDGTAIAVRNEGVRRGPAEILRLIAQGRDVDPALYYFRTSVRFEAAPGRHQWLTESMFLCSGARRPDHVLLQVFEVG